MTKTITRHSIKSHLDNADQMILVEALPEKYFNDAHLPGAVQINHDEVAAKAPVLLPDKGAEIVVYCANAACANSAKAAASLEEIGYTNIFQYVDGKQDWIDAGLPTEGAT